jgi:hypothetical protein
LPQIERQLSRAQSRLALRRNNKKDTASLD